MKSIGNDIVDLGADEPQLHERFLLRAFTASERSAIGEDSSKLWLYWSAKEAAYKAIKRINPQVVFSPSFFEYSPEKQTVSFDKHIFYCVHQQSPEYVYTFCCNNPELVTSGLIYNWIEKKPQISACQHSHAVRDLASIKISEVLKNNNLTIPLTSPAAPLPCLILEGQISQNLLSFTHHGNFVACCFLRN